MNRLEAIARGMLRPINPYATFILGFFTLFWGVWVLSPFWQVFGTAPLFSRMSEFAPEWAWGSWAAVSGALVCLAVFKGYYKQLAFALAFIAWHWFTVGMMMWWGDWQNTGGVTYTFVGIYSLYAYLNIKTNYVKFHEEPPHFM